MCYAGMRFFRVLALSIIAVGLIVTPTLMAQEPSAQPSEKPSGAGWVWLEQFSGSSNTDGTVMALTSSTGYNFNSHIGLFGGLPIYFIPSVTTPNGTASVNGIGDLFVGLRLAFANPAVNYRMTLTGTAPTGDASKGLSTGHVTFDWTNHFDHRFGRLTPFANLGLANSVPDTLFYERQFITYGYLAHFQAGSAVRLVHRLSAIVSAYDIEPWGSQTVDSRVVDTNVAGLPGLLGKITGDQAFEVTHTATGGASLTRDDGLSAGLDLNLKSIFDIWGGYSRSFPLQLDTVSFGLGVNLSDALRSLPRY